MDNRVRLSRRSAHAWRETIASRSHAVVLGSAAALWRDPCNDLVGIHDVARLAVHAVRRVDLQARRAVGVVRDFIDVRRTEPDAGVSVFWPTDGAADFRVHEQVCRLILLM